MLEDIKAPDEFKVEFSDKDNWAEVVDFAAILETIIEFIKKILKFEFDM